MLWSVKRQRCSHIQELSPKANEILNKYYHFYNKPFESRELSSASASLILSGLILVIIGLFNDFWWGIAIGFGYCMVIGYVGFDFDPTGRPMDDDEKSAHSEINAYFEKLCLQLNIQNMEKLSSELSEIRASYYPLRELLQQKYKLNTESGQIKTVADYVKDEALNRRNKRMADALDRRSKEMTIKLRQEFRDYRTKHVRFK